jgi:hypothetical protein
MLRRLSVERALRPLATIKTSVLVFREIFVDIGDVGEKGWHPEQGVALPDPFSRADAAEDLRRVSQNLQVIATHDLATPATPHPVSIPTIVMKRLPAESALGADSADFRSQGSLGRLRESAGGLQSRNNALRS